MRLSMLVAVVLFLSLPGCGDGDQRPDTTKTGVGQACPTAGCAAGQDCVTAAGPGGDTSTCEIRCGSDTDCPERWECNIPPIAPDSLPNVCVEE